MTSQSNFRLSVEKRKAMTTQRKRRKQKLTVKKFIQIGKDFPLIAVGLANKVRIKGISANKH
ncbi:hypothetical protein P5673_031235 [Acropora cervicornis]|uniref:Uncharacterized protein n=1 Tax=Acropora cervicornis TaxID=6130 RepID=A0AAD9PT37_ACRCE|nr:hypothetical protein P5673_031235 [Acropora cervicornis]